MNVGIAMGRNPAVSVIVPCFNLGEFLPEALDSVYSQTFQDFEVVVVNDGSTDLATNRLIEGLARPKLRAITTPNRGLPAARNLAIEHSRGRYICALDADDKLHPQFLEKTVSLLEDDPSVAFVSTWLECFGLETWTWRQDRCDFPTLLAECVVLTASPVRRDAVEAIGGYDTQFSEGDEDWDFWISLVERGYRGTVLPEVLFYYRQRPGSMRRECSRPEVKKRLWNLLLQKHRASYERFVGGVLLHKEDECGRLLLENWKIERELAVELKPQLAEKRELLQSLEAAAMPFPEHESHSAEAPMDDRASLETALRAAEAEVAALKASKSWRITAPLRRVLDAWLALRARFGRPARRD